MSNSLTLGAYWKPRRESIEECADRLLAFMTAIGECGSNFVHWYHKGRSRNDALRKEIAVRDRDELLALLDKGRHRGDIEKTIIEDLGFSVGIWNGGAPGKEASLSIACGLYWVSPSPNASLSNYVVLNLPEDLGDLADPAKASWLLALTARCWVPDWAGIFSNEAMNSRDWGRQPFVDWMVYIPQRIASVSPPSTVTHLESGGSLIVVQPNPPALKNPEDQERIRRIEQIVRP